MKGTEMAEDRRRGRPTKGRQVVAPVSAEARDKAMRELMTAPVIEPATQAVLFGIGLQASLREAAAGRFGAIRLGRLYKIPSEPVRQALGLSPVQTGTDHAAEAA